MFSLCSSANAGIFASAKMEGLAARNGAFEQGWIAGRQSTVVARARNTTSLDVSRVRTGNNLRGFVSNGVSHARAQMVLQI